MLEPTSSQEMKDMTLAAFEMSEALELPVIIRTTTRLAHVRGAVELGSLKPVIKKATFEKNPFRFVTVPAVSRNLHKVLLEKFDKAAEISNSDAYNEVIGNGKWGIIGNGACFNYVKDAVSDLGIEDKVSMLKLAMSWPQPNALHLDFMKKMEKVLVVEELEPINETELKALAQENGITIPIKGKGVGAFSRLYEYDPGMVRQTIADYFGIEYKAPIKLDLSTTPEMPARPPNLCAGCPHRATYYAVKQVFGAKRPSSRRISAVIPWGFYRPFPWRILSSAWDPPPARAAGLHRPQTRKWSLSSAIPPSFTPVSRA
jgi:indolepyruvate ferredoxin oxidoreductase alpha subunit